jgi:hypothetical protein
MAGIPISAPASAAKTNPLQFLLVDFLPLDRREVKVLELGIGNRRVKYGRNVRPRLEIQDEHTEIDLKEHTGDVLDALRLSAWSGEETRFATAGDDHKIVIWNVHGRPIFELSEHSARIGALWELTGKRLASWSEDKSLIVWDTNKGIAISSAIRTKCSPLRICVDRDGEFFCLSQYWRARIVDVDGFQIARLNWQFEPVADIRRLSSGRWITQSGGGIKLWSSRGKLQHKLERPFALSDGYLELSSGELLTIDDAHYLDLFNHAGSKIGSRAKDEALAKALRRFIRSRTRAREALAARTSYVSFEHRTNPFSEPTPKSATANGTALSEDQQEERRLFAEFFERPDQRSIRAWLRDEVEAAVQARERVEAALHADYVRASNARLIQGFAIAVGGAAVWILSKHHQSDAAFVLVLIAIVAVVVVMWTQLTVSAVDAAQRILAALPFETDRLVTEVKTHRRRIIAGIPSLRAHAIYSGNEVRRQIRKTLAALAQTALRESGVVEEDLLNADKIPIAMSDWTALRCGEQAEWDHPISDRSLTSFWWSHDGHFVFAVHSIQFVMLTARKIDVWTVDYDFLTGQAHNKATLSVCYADVTDVVQRRVRRQFALAGVTATIDAAEVVLLLTGGGSVSLSAVDNDAPELRSAVQKQTAASLADQLRNLETEELARPRGADYSHEALKMEREFLRSEIDALKPVRVSTAPHAADALDDVVASIKRQVLAHKTPPAA